MLESWQRMLCLAFEIYISLMSSLSWLSVSVLLNLMLMSTSDVSFALPLPGDLDCFRLMMLLIVV